MAHVIKLMLYLQGHYFLLKFKILDILIRLSNFNPEKLVNFATY